MRLIGVDVAVMALALAGGGVAAREESDPPANAIVLFVASWCAPCHAELRALPEIAAAAAPMRVFVAPVDNMRATARMMARVPADRQWRMPPAVATAAMRRLAGGAPGLPTSVAVDPAGKVCAVVRKPLSAEVAAVVRGRCL